MSDFDWDQFNTPSGEYFAFREIGDKVVGTLTVVRIGKDFNGNPCPELVIETDDGPRTVTAGQVMLQRKLSEIRPEVGQRIAIVYSGHGDAKPGKAPAKLFDVQVGAAPAEPAVASAVPSASSLV